MDLRSARSRLSPLSSMPEATRRDIIAVLTDIDDTLTTDGKLTAQAYAAMERLQNSGKLVIPVTGRPAGWCDHIARMWPVDAVVGENGAFYMHYDASRRKLTRRFQLPDAQMRALRGRIDVIGQKIVASVPGCALASDQRYRETDLAIDYCEDVAPLDPVDVDRIVAMMESEGMTAKVSSIHVNGWFGTYDKLAMSRTLLAEVHQIALDEARDRFVFVGDSPNDAPMFAHFPNAVGVANLRRFTDRVAHLPTFITEAEAGAGFTELADFLLAS